MEKPTRTAMMLSAVMAPGAGQFVQRRWLAGAFFLITFLICLVCLLVEVVRPMVANILISLDVAEHKSNAALVRFRTGPILTWLGLSVLMYVISLLDTALAYARQCRQWARQQSRLWMSPGAPGNPS